MYAELSSDLDFVSAVYGDDTAPLSIGCDGCTFFQSSPGGVSYNLGTEINTIFFSVYPDLEYDSWLTIGSESVVGSSEISVVGDGLTDGLDLFNQGSGFSLDDAIGSSWFNLFPCAGVSDLAACAEGNPAFAGEDNRVLLAQLTANGDIYGILNVQVFLGEIKAMRRRQKTCLFPQTAQRCLGAPMTQQTTTIPMRPQMTGHACIPARFR